MLFFDNIDIDVCNYYSIAPPSRTRIEKTMFKNLEMKIIFQNSAEKKPEKISLQLKINNEIFVKKKSKD